MSRHTETLALCPLFECLDAESIRCLDTRCIWQSYEPNDVINSVDSGRRSIFFFVGGAARVQIRSSNGKRIIVKDLRRGDFFAELELLNQHSEAGVEIVALTNVIVSKMGLPIFEDVVARNPDVLPVFIATITQENKRLLDRVAEFSFLCVKERIISELLRLGKITDHIGAKAIISPPPFHSEIAARVSTHREAVSRVIRDLEKDNLIERRRGAIVINNISELRSLLAVAGQTSSKNAP